MKYEIKQDENWFSIYNVETGKLRHIGGATLEAAERELAHVEFLDTPEGKAYQERVAWRPDNWTGD